MSQRLYLISSVFPEPDRLPLLALFFQEGGEVASVFRQRAIYHRGTWKHETTRMVLRCLNGLLRYGFLDSMHLQALFYKRKSVDTKNFFVMVRKILGLAPDLRALVVIASSRNIKCENDKLAMKDQHLRFGVYLFTATERV